MFYHMILLDYSLIYPCTRLVLDYFRLQLVDIMHVWLTTTNITMLFSLPSQLLLHHYDACDTVLRITCKMRCKVSYRHIHTRSDLFINTDCMQHAQDLFNLEVKYMQMRSCKYGVCMMCALCVKNVRRQACDIMQRANTNSD